MICVDCGYKDREDETCPECGGAIEEADYCCSCECEVECCTVWCVVCDRNVCVDNCLAGYDLESGEAVCVECNEKFLGNTVVSEEAS